MTISRDVQWQSLGSPEIWRSRFDQRPIIAWLTGLSGSGKTTLALACNAALEKKGRRAVILDGDNLRHGLNRDLGFSVEERAENIRRTAEVARLFAEAGLIVIVATISPRREDRETARKIAGAIPFLEVFIDTPLEICEFRDPKGLYNQARAGRILNFTGISSPYEIPESPDLRLTTQKKTVNESVFELVEIIMQISNLSTQK